MPCSLAGTIKFVSTKKWERSLDHKMAEVYPFIGTRYNSQLIGNLGKVICPPGDAISADLQAELYDRHENNVVRLVCARGDGDDDDEAVADRYTRAANALGTWRSDGVFIEDEKPSFYLYEQVFTGPDGNEHRRVSFVAKVKLEEATPIDPDAVDGLSGGRADQLNLIRSTKANISGVTSLFNDPQNEVINLLQGRMQEKPWEETKDDAGVTHRLWVVQKRDLLLKIVEAMKTRQLYIAEGHARYIAAQVYRDEMRVESGKADGKQPFDYLMMVLIPAQQEGLEFTATHRALTKTVMADVDLKDALEELEDHFEILKEKANPDGGTDEARRIQDRLQELGHGKTAIAMVHASGSAFYLVMKDDVLASDLYDDCTLPECIGSLDACVLHNFIINQVFIGNPEYELEDDECLYLPSAEKVLELLKNKKAVCGFILNAVTVPRMMDIARAGVYMPLEIGVLLPRPVTGLVLRNMQTDTPKIAKR